jgi:hypothetical protein
MLMPDVDAILIDYSTPENPLRRLNTDFYAFRPAAVDPAALMLEFNRQATAESTWERPCILFKNRAGFDGCPIRLVSRPPLVSRGGNLLSFTPMRRSIPVPTIGTLPMENDGDRELSDI